MLSNELGIELRAQSHKRILGNGAPGVPFRDAHGSDFRKNLLECWRPSLPLYIAR